MITFRPHTRADIPFRVQWLNNTKATAFAIDDPEHVTTAAEQAAWFTSYEAGTDKRFFTILDDGMPIGFAGFSGIDRDKKQASIFIMIGEDESRGRGIGGITLDFLIAQARTELKLTVLTLEVDKRNQAALKLYESRGFVPTADRGSEIAMELQCTENLHERLKAVRGSAVCPVAIIIRDQKVLLGHRHYTPDKWKTISVWTVPGGRCDDGETIESTLRREVQEETGVSDLKILDFIAEVPGAKAGDLVPLFLCSTATEPVLKEPEKFSSWQWFGAGDFPEAFINQDAKSFILDLLK